MLLAPSAAVLRHKGSLRQLRQSPDGSAYRPVQGFPQDLPSFSAVGQQLDPLVHLRQHLLFDGLTVHLQLARLQLRYWPSANLPVLPGESATAPQSEPAHRRLAMAIVSPVIFRSGARMSLRRSVTLAITVFGRSASKTPLMMVRMTAGRRYSEPE